MIDQGEAILARLRGEVGAANVAVFGTVASASMETEQPGYRPSDLLQDAASLICFGVPVPRGAYEHTHRTTETIWRSQNLTYRRLDTLALRFAELVEQGGGRALPIYGCYPLAVSKRGEVVGFINLVRVAELTGIGTVGRNGLLYHRHFGSRLMLGGVVSSVALPDFVLPGGDTSGCPEDCRLCVDACPVRAISPETGRVDIMKCLAYTARTPFMSKLLFGIQARIQPRRAARTLNLRTIDEHVLHVCSRCVQSCPY